MIPVLVSHVRSILRVHRLLDPTTSCSEPLHKTISVTAGFASLYSTLFCFVTSDLLLSFIFFFWVHWPIVFFSGMSPAHSNTHFGVELATPPLGLWMNIGQHLGVFLLEPRLSLSVLFLYKFGYMRLFRLHLQNLCVFFVYKLWLNMLTVSTLYPVTRTPTPSRPVLLASGGTLSGFLSSQARMASRYPRFLHHHLELSRRVHIHDDSDTSDIGHLHLPIGDFSFIPVPCRQGRISPSEPLPILHISD